VDVYENDKMIATLERGQMIGYEVFRKTEKYGSIAMARSQCTLLVLTKEDLFDQMSKHIEILHTFIKIANKLDHVEIEEEPEISDILIGG
jgi:CRP-like cAMP-binding protein